MDAVKVILDQPGEHMDIQEEIRILLGSQGWQRPPELPASVQDYDVRASAASNLARAGCASVEVLAALARAALLDEERAVRETALESLVQLQCGTAALVLLAAATYDPDELVRGAALEALWQLDRAAATQVCQRLVHDSDVDVAEYAARILQLASRPSES